MHTFSAFSLLNESSNTINLFNNRPKEINFFGDTIDFLINENRLLALEKANLYINIYESEDNTIAVNESFDDFFGAIKDFIKKVIDFFKKLIAKFWVRINSLFMTDRYIKNHEDDLNKFSSIHEFTIKGYTFTITENMPSKSVLVELNTLCSKVANFANADGSDVITLDDYDNIVALNKSLKDDNDKDLDEIRKKCLGVNYNIESSEYSDELFKFYRNGEDFKSEITIDKTEVIKALNVFKNYEKLKSSTNKDKKDIENLYKKMSDSISLVEKQKRDASAVDNAAIKTKPEDGTAVSKSEYLDKMNLLSKQIAQRITDTTNIHLMAYSAKLDAIRDRFNQDKVILYGAFKKILAKNEAEQITMDIDVLPDLGVQ